LRAACRGGRRAACAERVPAAQGRLLRRAMWRQSRSCVTAVAAWFHRRATRPARRA
jgi:hypothetical protein